MTRGHDASFDVVQYPFLPRCTVDMAGALKQKPRSLPSLFGYPFVYPWTSDSDATQGCTKSRDCVSDAIHGRFHAFGWHLGYHPACRRLWLSLLLVPQQLPWHHGPCRRQTTFSFKRSVCVMLRRLNYCSRFFTGILVNFSQFGLDLFLLVGLVSLSVCSWRRFLWSANSL